MPSGITTDSTFESCPDMTEPNPHLRFATLSWNGGFSFTGGQPGGPTITIDGKSGDGPSPVVTLLMAGAACSGADLVSILEKKRITLSDLRFEVVGRRAEDYPRRFVEITMKIIMAGEGLTMAHAERAVELSVSKYCSVMLSLNPDIPIHTEIVIES